MGPSGTLRYMKKKETYSFADPIFYESPHLAKREGIHFEVAGRESPEGWRHLHRDVWTTMIPPDTPRLRQGWKIHVSACPDNVERVLGVVWEYCVSHEIAFKFLPDRLSFLALNGKGASREDSGKAATIYPAHDDELLRILNGLSPVLENESGPYILSDVRWHTGPLYVRYGGFADRVCFGENGEQRLAIENQDGVLVPDRREPFFELPPWVQAPGFLAPHLAIRSRAGELDRLPYRILRALHFSNGGGVYLAERLEDGRQIVLKEARPLAGLDRDGHDAVTRMSREATALARLADVPGVAALHDEFAVGDHRFLAVEYIAGLNLTAWVDRNNPLTGPPPSHEDLTRYRDRALAILDRVDRLLAAIHSRGLIHGDLHPDNILVGTDDTVSVIDFELSADITNDSYRPALRFPGFAPISPKTGAEVDLHALAMLRYWIFLPLHQILELAPEKVEEFVMEAERRFDLPAGHGHRVLRELTRPGPRADTRTASPSPAQRRRREALGAPLEVALDTEDPDWEGIRASLARAIWTSSTPERPDRLFPGSFEQFVYGGMGFAYGAAGILWAMSVSNVERSPRHEQWLLQAARRNPDRRPGFYDGLHGLAYVLNHLGHHDQALETLERAIVQGRESHAGNLFNGLAGMGLNLLHFAGLYDDGRLRDEVGTIADRLAATVTRGGPGAPAGPDPSRSGRASDAQPATGLLRGWSGIGLFFLRLYENTGDNACLDLAGQAIHHDLRSCRASAGGGLSVTVGTRTFRDLERGSAGIALVADEFLGHRADDRIESSLPALIHACRSDHVAEVSLLDGRAGFLEALARLRPESAEQVIAGELRRLSRHAVPYHGHLAFPRHYRLSMDLAHGTAGVLLMVCGAGDRRTSSLPFLGERRSTSPTRHMEAAAAGMPWQSPQSGHHEEQEAETRGLAVLDLQRLRPSL